MSGAGAAPPAGTAGGVRIIYDGQCPACAAYFRLQRLRDIGIAVEMVDAREHPELVRAYSARGIELDHDFVLLVGEAEYIGADAALVLASIGNRASLARRINFRLFSTPAVAGVVYPVMRLGRRALLMLLGRKRLGRRGA